MAFSIYLDDVTAIEAEIAAELAGVDVCVWVSDIVRKELTIQRALSIAERFEDATTNLAQADDILAKARVGLLKPGRQQRRRHTGCGDHRDLRTAGAKGRGGFSASTKGA